jgi:trimeric autotransporter adhesin
MTLSENGYLSLNPLDTATAGEGFDSVGLELAASAFNSSTVTAEKQRFHLVTEPEGNNTATPSGRLSLLFGSGAGSPTATGLSINADGTINFAPLQSFPGDISAVNAGTGLTGGGTSGNVSLSIAGSYQLPQGCGANQVPKWSGGNWTCADDSNTSYTAGSGLNLAGTTFSVAPAGITSAMIASAAVGSAGLADGAVTASKLAIGSVNSSNVADGSIGAADVNAVEIQARIIGSCSQGNAVRVVNQDGTVTCQSAGSGTVTSVSVNAPLTVTNPTTTPNIALPNVKIEVSNTAIGTGALSSNTTGINNTASGRNVLYSNTTGTDNTASGISALEANTFGIYNTASGAYALQDNTTGNFNTASGAGALTNNTTGGSNTASGFFTLPSNTTGNFNTASGRNALYSNTTGTDNTASGMSALQSNTFGISNTASGAYALQSNTFGNFNTASGSGALQSNTTGTLNTAVGMGADVSTWDLTNATAIGAQAVVTASNKIRLGNSSVTVIEGQVAFTSVSDRNQKENFQPVDGEEVLKKIRQIPVQSWNYIGQDPRQFRHYGPMAQDFFTAFGHDGVGAVGSETTINSGDLAGILMVAAQALENRTAEQKQDIDSLKAENADLKARLDRLEKLLLAREALAQR